MPTGDGKLAATLFILLGEEIASEVLRHLNETEIGEISRLISTVGAIPAGEAEKYAEELFQLLNANRIVSEGGVDYARKVIERTLGGAGQHLMDGLADGANAFEAVSRMNPLQISKCIQNESPQTIAVILSNLSATNSAELLASLPPELQADVAVRMAKLDNISTPGVIRGISSVLEEKLKPVGNSISVKQSPGGVRAVAEVFNRMERPRSKTVLEKIENETPEMANSIRQLMFVFEDLATLDDAAIREILQRVEKKTMAVALKGANEQQQQQFYRNMSGRAAEMMKEEIDVMGPIKSKDVHAAQQKIIETVRKLEEEGLIATNAGDEYVV